MTLLIAAGPGSRTGRLVAAIARDRGHRVQPLAALDDPDTVADALRDADAVVIIPEPGDAERHAHAAVRTLTVAARRHAPAAHLLLVTSFAVGHGPAHPFNRVTASLPGRLAAERALRASGLAWTVIRPTWLTDDPPGAHAVRVAPGPTGRWDARARRPRRCARRRRRRARRARHDLRAVQRARRPPARLGAHVRGPRTRPRGGPRVRPLPDAQHAWEATFRTDARGRPVAPRFHRLLMLDVGGTPTAGDAERLETALQTLEQASTRARRTAHLPRMGRRVVPDAHIAPEPGRAPAADGRVGGPGTRGH
jgi:uncharacterized protein YbjT (DUF2867 family)